MKLKKIIALTMATAMIALTACGGSNNGGGNSGNGGSSNVQVNLQSNHFFKQTQIELPENFKDIYQCQINGDVIYYTVYGNADNSGKTGVYSYNILTKESSAIVEFQRDSKDVYAENSYISAYNACDNGDVIYVDSIYKLIEADPGKDYSHYTLDDCIGLISDNWGESYEQAKKDIESYYKEQYADENGVIDAPALYKALVSWDAESESKIDLVKVSATGDEIFKIELSGKNDPDAYVNNVISDKDGNAYVSASVMDRDGNSVNKLSVYDNQGNKIYEYETQEYFGELKRNVKGQVMIPSYAEDTPVFLIVDPVAKEIKKDKDLEFIYSLQVKDENSYVYSDDSSVSICDANGKNPELYLKWLDVDISAMTVRSFGFLSNGDLLAYTERYSNAEKKEKCELIQLTEIPASEVVQKKLINVGLVYMDYTFEDYIIEYNKKSPDYRVNVVSFDYLQNFDDYDTALKNYMTELSTNDNIDIMVFDFSPSLYQVYQNLASKGKLLDLKEISAGKPVNMDMILDNIVESMTLKDKVYGIPARFSVQTLAGKKSDLGDKKTWTVQEAIDFKKSKPDSSYFMLYANREDALRTSIVLNHDKFIDYENATCDFDNQEFASILEYASLFPENTDAYDFLYSEGKDETEYIKDGRILLNRTYMYSPADMRYVNSTFGEPTTIVGFPTFEGNGAMLSYGYGVYTITKNCKYPDAAWEVISTMFQDTLQKDEDIESYFYFPVRKDMLDKMLKYYENKDFSNENGYGYGVLDSAIGGYMGKAGIEQQPNNLTKEDMDKVKDIVTGATAVEGSVSQDIINIILEEADSYFSGTKSAADVAKIVQSRVRMYLSETQ